MDQLIDGALKDWKFIRGNSRDFVTSLGDAGLRTQLPRPELDSFCKHFEEMIDVQRDYVNAILRGRMAFEGEPTASFRGQLTADQILRKMAEVDATLEQVLIKADPYQVVAWPGDEGAKTLASHLASMAMHEALHIGQMIAFAYATRVRIPSELVSAWALSAQEL